MGLFIYNLSLLIFRQAVWLASFFNKKAKLMTDGQKNILTHISEELKSNSKPIAWFHCASLGEFEQGRPVIEAFRKEFRDFKIILTFFSPSGYELRKDYEYAEYIYYLPWDSAANAKKFIEITQPEVVFFVKYEFWHHYLHELWKNKVPAILFSAIFRKEQLFFKPHGAFYRSILKKFDFLFVQNQSSLQLLNSIGINNCAIAGDTRFDRVQEICKNAKSIPVVEKFKNKLKTIIIGSSWPEDLHVLLPFINAHPKLKFIIAPHEINESAIKKLEKNLAVSSIRFSEAREESIINKSVLIINNIGLLSSLYRYADIAYIGGAFGKGLHNTLEAATFGIPIFFGNKKYDKFQEAVDLIQLGGAFAIANAAALENQMGKLLENNEELTQAGQACKSYVERNLGSTQKILSYTIRKLKK